MNWKQHPPNEHVTAATVARTVARTKADERSTIDGHRFQIACCEERSSAARAIRPEKAVLPALLASYQTLQAQTARLFKDRSCVARWRSSAPHWLRLQLDPAPAPAPAASERNASCSYNMTLESILAVIP